MKRDDDRPNLLVIDDNDDFLELIEQTLAGDFAVTALLSDLEYGQMKVAVQDARPDYVLLDVNLHRATASRDILRDLTADAVLPETCKLWLISHVAALISDNGSEGSRELVGQFQEINARVQGKLLRKPINPRVLRAELLDEVVFEPPEILDTLPLPTRVLHPGGTVVFHNSAWGETNPYEPDPMPYLDEFKEDSTPEQGHHSGCPFLPDRVGYTLHSFPLYQEGEEFLAQVATPHPAVDVLKHLNEIVSKVFEAMAEVGFTRGRLYRIDTLDQDVLEQKEDRVLVLTQVSDGHSDRLSASLPLRRPLRGVLAERVDGYGPISREKLSYWIRTAKEDACVPADPDIQWWNEHLSIRTAGNEEYEYPPLESWLEVPVLADVPEDEPIDPSTGDPERKPVGLMVFDKLNWPGKNGDQDGTVFDTGPAVIQEVHVVPIEVLLNNLLLMLGAATQQAHKEDMLGYERRMRRMDGELGEAADDTGRYSAILRGMCDVAKARSAIMVVKESGDERLAVVSTHGDAIPDSMPKMRFPLDAEYHPVVAVWKSGKANACADFQGSGIKERIKSGLLERNPPHWQSLTKEQQTEFFTWLDRIGGVMAVPITVAGRTIGAVILQFSQPWLITRARVQRIQAVLHRARWVMQEVVREDERKHWHRLLRHDLSSAINTCLRSFLVLENSGNAPTAEADWWMTKRHLIAASDLAENWSDIERIPSARSQAGKGFEPRQCFETFIEMDQVRVHGLIPGTPPIAIRWEPEDRQAVAWTQPLAGDEEAFCRIVRTLLDNAFKFGLSHSTNDSNPAVPVTIAAEVLNSSDGRPAAWRVCVRNPGHMTEAEYANRFKAGYAVQGQRPRGAHIGLSAAHRIVEILGGSIEVENKPDQKHVLATLTWPLVLEDSR